MLKTARMLVAVLALAPAGGAFAAAANEAPIDATLEQLFSGELEGRLVTAEGVVTHAARRSGGRLAIHLGTRFARFQATITDARGLDPAALEDARIRVTGRARMIRTPSHEIFGAEVRAGSAADIRVVTPAPKDPFSIPLSRIADLRADATDAALLHRHRVRGVVTFSRPGEQFVFIRQQDGRTLRALLRTRNAFRPGDVVDLSGFIDFRSSTTRLDDALARKVGNDPAAVPPPVATTITALRQDPLPDKPPFHDWFGELVTVEGRIFDVVRRETYLQLALVDAGGQTAAASFPLARGEHPPEALRAGAVVRVTGAVSMTYQLWPREDIGVQDLTINAEDFGGAEVVRAAPWWTPGRVAALLGLVSAVAVAALLWGFFLRRAVIRQTRRLEANIRLQHDAELEFEAAKRERLRLSHDLHDGFQQLLAGSMFRLKAAMNYLPEGSDKAREQLASAQQSLMHTQRGLRAALWGLTEESEGPADLVGLFNYAAQRMAHWEDVVRITHEGTEPPLPRHVVGALLMVLQEAVGNAIHHGCAKRVDVRVAFAGERLEMTVADDGCGFDSAAAAPEGHYGLASMRDRVRGLGGGATFAITSAPGRGATVAVTIDLSRLPPATPILPAAQA